MNNIEQYRDKEAEIHADEEAKQQRQRDGML